MMIAPPPSLVIFPRQSRMHEYVTNLADGMYVVRFYRNVAAADAVYVVRGGRLLIWLDQLDLASVYKVVALRISNGEIAQDAYWLDRFVYDPGTVNLTFTSSGNNTGTGDLKSVTGTVYVADQPAARTVIATALDAAQPYQLSRTVSAQNGQYTLEWRGYTGKIVLTFLDDYGVAHSEGAQRGVGERVHPEVHNGYTYEVITSGVLGPAPVWPQRAGETVWCGTVKLVAVTFYRAVSEGPFTV